MYFGGFLLYDRKKNKFQSSVWRVCQFLVLAGNWHFFVVAGKFYHYRKKKIQPEKKVLSILLWLESFIFLQPEKKSSIYFVVAGKFYYDQKKVPSILLWRKSFITTKVLSRPEKKVPSILLWRESFITTGRKVLSILLWRESFIMTRKKKVPSILLWQESFITT